MHKLIFTLLLIITINYGFTQTITSRFGINRFSLISDDIELVKSKKGSHVAVGYEPYITENFALHFEIEYCTQQNLTEPVSSSSSAEIE